MNNNLEAEMNIIYKIVWGYVKINPGLEFEDLVSEACLVYLENIDLYDETKGKRSTFIYHIVKNHINTLLNKSNFETPVLDTEFDTLAGNMTGPENALIQKERSEELFGHLSPNAQAVCDIIFGNDLYLPIDTPRKCRGIIVNELRKENWSWNNIWKTIKELKYSVAEIY